MVGIQEIRIPELLSEREQAVGEMLPEVGVEASSMSQQLAVLRRAGLVTFRKEGSIVYYSLTSPQVADLLRVVRRILTEVISGQAELLADLQVESPAGRSSPPGQGSRGNASPRAPPPPRAVGCTQPRPGVMR